MIKKYKHNFEKDGLKKKLAAYSALAGAFVALSPAHTDAAIVYTDVNPDSILGSMPSIYALDLDNNGTPDFNINFDSYASSSPGYQYIARGAAVQVLGSNRFMGSSTSYYAQVLNLGNPINAAQLWYGGSFSYGILGVFLSYMSSGSTYTYGYGNWLGQTDKYLGLEFDIAGQTHYGWVRLDLKASATSVRIKDYAYEDVANTQIDAGDTGAPLVAADTAQSVNASDIADSGTSTDMEISFNKATDETTIQEYRIIIVKSADATTFDINAADGVSLANMTSVTPTGSNIVQVMPVNSKDKDGDLITFNIPYKAFVLSVANGTSSFVNSLSNESNEVTLNVPLINADAATNLQAADVADNGNGLDLEVSFDKAADETKVGEYRIIVVKSQDASTFTLAAADAAVDYESVTPNGSNISQMLGSGSKDKDGDLITVGTPYKAFVLSVADGINANVNQLSVESNEVVLDNMTGVADIHGNSLMPDVFSHMQSIYVKFPSGLNSIHDLKIVNLAGQTVASYDVVTGNKSIQVKNLSNGMYLVQYKFNSKSFSKKLYLGTN